MSESPMERDAFGAWIHRTCPRIRAYLERLGDPPDSNHRRRSSLSVLLFSPPEVPAMQIYWNLDATPPVAVVKVTTRRFFRSDSTRLERWIWDAAGAQWVSPDNPGRYVANDFLTGRLAASLKIEYRQRKLAEDGSSPLLSEDEAAFISSIPSEGGALKPERVELEPRDLEVLAPAGTERAQS